MDGPRDYHTKWSKSDRKKTPYAITYMWNLKYDTSQHIYKTEQTHRHIEQTCGYQGGGVGGKDGLRD